MNVSICVISFQRPKGLRTLLESLNQIELGASDVQLEVVIVDNDTRGDVLEVCRAIRSDFRWRLRCLEEPRRGIPFARNAAIDGVLPDADFLIFVDDDETVEPGWLDELLRVQHRYRADIVAAAVEPRFKQPPSPWMERLFHRLRHETGTQLPQAYTNNVLVRMDVLRETGVRFDPRMAMMGGSDTHLFRRLHLLGYQIVWADDAVVYDWFPPSRVSVRWLLKRSYRIGASRAFVDIDLLPKRQALPRLIHGGCERLVHGTLVLAVGWARGKERLVYGLMRIAAGTGMLMGIVGVRHREYRTIHGE